MNFFKKLFVGQSSKVPKGNGPMPTRTLNFQFSVTPDNGSKFAQQFVESVKKIDQKDLDYSVDTIDYVDEFLQRFRDEGLTVNDVAETIFVAGSYVGQVMINNNSGLWVKQDDIDLPGGVSMTPIVVKLSNGNIVDPIAKAFKRFHNGDSDNLKYFYQVFTIEKS